MKRSTITGAWLVSVAMILVACGGSASTDNRSRNILGSDGYEVPRVLTYEYEDVYDRTSSRPWTGGFTSAGAERWDSSLYAVGEGRARLAANTYEQVGPAVPPRLNRPAGTPPPIYERPVSSKVGAIRNFGTTTPIAPKVGKPMIPGNLSKVLGGLGNVGMSMGAMVAVAGLGMALDALGAPPFLTALFGGPDPQIMAALQQIMQTLEEMNKKLDQINNKLDDVQGSVDNISSALQLLSTSVCSASVTSTSNDLANIVEPINNRWLDVYVNNQSIGAMSSNNYSKNQSDFLDLQLKDIQAINPRTAIERIESIVLGNGAIASNTSAQSGLLSQVQMCTLANNRYLTNEHTAAWQNLVVLAIAAEAQAAELATWAELYNAMVSKKSVSLTNLNLINLTLRKSVANLGFHASMQIPEGQVLDTVTNKMWRMGPRGTAKVSLHTALSECLDDNNEFLNYAPVPSWNGTSTRSLNTCPATQEIADLATGVPLDRGANTDPARDIDAQRWRVPTVGEITTNQKNFAATASSSNVGLLDSGVNKSGTLFEGWTKSKCGSQRARTCTTPADYLSTYGYKAIPSDLNVIWTNTTAAMVGQAGTLPYAAGKVTPQVAYSIYNSTGGATDSKLYGFCEDGQQLYFGDFYNYLDTNAPSKYYCASLDWSGFSGGFTFVRPGYIQRPLGKILSKAEFEKTNFLIPAIPVNATSEPDTRRDHYCFRLASKITKSGHTADEWSNWNNTEMMVFNLGGTTTNQNKVVMPWGKNGANIDIAAPATYRSTDPGKTNLYFANRKISDSSFICKHDWYETTVVKLPQTAQTMWVRNLAPNESYYTVTSNVGPTGNADLRSFAADLTPPTVSFLSLNGQAVVNGWSPSSYVMKCLVDPPTDPLTSADVLANGIDCPISFDSYADGPHRIYAVGSRSVKGKAVTSNIEVADIAISHVFQSNGVIATSSSTPSTSSSIVENVVITAKSTASDAIQSDGISRLPERTTGQNAVGTDLAALLRLAHLSVKPGDEVNVSIAAASKSVCSFVSPTLRGLKSGACNVTVTVTTRKNKKVVKKTSKKVSVRVT